MGSARLLSTPPTPDQVADRKRVGAILDVWLDALLLERRAYSHPGFQLVLAGVAQDLVHFKRCVADGSDAADFAALRDKEAARDGGSGADRGDERRAAPDDGGGP